MYIMSFKSCISVQHLVQKLKRVPSWSVPIKRTEDGYVFLFETTLALVVHEKYTTGSHAEYAILWPRWLSCCGWNTMTLTAGLWFVIFNTCFSLHSYWALIHHFRYILWGCFNPHIIAGIPTVQQRITVTKTRHEIHVYMFHICISWHFLLFLLAILLSVSDICNVTDFIQHVPLAKLLQ